MPSTLLHERGRREGKSYTISPSRHLITSGAIAVRVGTLYDRDEPFDGFVRDRSLAVQGHLRQSEPERRRKQVLFDATKRTTQRRPADRVIQPLPNRALSRDAPDGSRIERVGSSVESVAGFDVPQRDAAEEGALIARLMLPTGQGDASLKRCARGGAPDVEAQQPGFDDPPPRPVPEGEHARRHVDAHPDRFSGLESEAAEAHQDSASAHRAADDVLAVYLDDFLACTGTDVLDGELEAYDPIRADLRRADREVAVGEVGVAESVSEGEHRCRGAV